MIVVFEGLDGSGKGTQISSLKREFGCKVIRYPTKRSPKLRAYLNGRVKLESKEIFDMFLSDIMDDQEVLKSFERMTYKNAKTFLRSIGKMVDVFYSTEVSGLQPNPFFQSVNKNELLIVDRYVFSTVAYKLKGISLERAKEIVLASKPIKPDLVFFIDVPAEEAVKRKQKQKQNPDIYEKDLEYLKIVRKHFIGLYNEKFLTKKWIKIDGTKSIKEISSEIRKYINFQK